MELEPERTPSIPPRVKELRTITRNVLDVAGIAGICFLSYANAWDWEVSVGCIGAILGLIRYAPIAKQGGPLGFLVAAALGAASISKSA